MYVVWIPALFSDGRDDALEASGECQDSRISYYWDADKRVGEAFEQPLELDRFAWDVYLLYDRGVRWGEGAPSQPGFWMHQLGGLAGAAPTLDSLVLRQRVEAALFRDVD